MGLANRWPVGARRPPKGPRDRLIGRLIDPGGLWHYVEEGIGGGAQMSRVILVSNRLPVQVRRSGGKQVITRSSGGLVAGLGLVHDAGGPWIGTLGIGKVDVPEEEMAKQRLVVVTPRKDDGKHHYEGYSNGVLWPLFHYLLDHVHYDSRDLNAYRRVNALFADAIVDAYQPGDRVWVHDYHLMLLPTMLRERLPEARIGFFLHIPFPSSEVYRILPHKEEVLAGLLGANLIGLHTYDYARHLISSFRRVLGVEFDDSGVRADDPRCHVGVFPLGVDVEGFQALAKAPEVERRYKRWHRLVGGRRVILGVDRMDYTKGIPLRLEAFRKLLNMDSKLCASVVLIQLAVPSRSTMPTYQALKADVDRLVGEINGTFESEGNVPVHYMYRSLPPEELVALYRVADVALVTPTRDGMNLVAKEYVASRVDDTGVLVLSEFAGAAAEMGEALLHNPWNIEGSAEAIKQALEMPPQEMGRRMAALRKRVKVHNVHRWVQRFLGALGGKDAMKKKGATVAYRQSEWLPTLQKGFTAAERALLTLDYDGTLTELVPTPSAAKPSPEVLELLRGLAELPNVEVVAISGRDTHTLDAWLGDLPIGLVAEHGARMRLKGYPSWEDLLGGADLSWKAAVLEVLDDFAARCPGAVIEEKHSALVWHYRQVEPGFGMWQARELAQHLSESFANSPIEVLHGAKIVEVRPQGFDKGRALRVVLERLGPFDFVLAAGDDRTDEDMFAAVPQGGWGIKVGAGLTQARCRVASPATFCELLRSLLGRHKRQGQRRAPRAQLQP